MLNRYTELTFVSMLSDPDLASKIRFFDPESLHREWSVYEDPLWQEINEIVNSPDEKDSDSDLPPFNIIDAEQSISDEGVRLDIVGKFELFDGLSIDVSFQGIYSNPESQKDRAFKLDPARAFNNFSLEARLHGSDKRQEDIFANIKLHDDKTSFVDGVVQRRVGQTGRIEAGLHSITKVRRIAAIYENLHIKDALASLAQHLQIFESTLAKYGQTALTELTIEEAVVFGGGKVNFLPYAKFSSAKETTAGLALPSYNAPFTVNFSYRTQVTEDDSYWEVIVVGNGLTKLLRLPTDIRVRELEPGVNVKTVAQTFEFIKGALGFVDIDPDDISVNTYAAFFNDHLIKAREEIKQKDPDYQPLVLTDHECNKHIGNHYTYTGRNKSDSLIFRTLDSFFVFEAMINLVRQNPFIEIDELAFDEEVQLRLGRDEDLRRRFMIFYDLFNEDAENVFKNLRARDPAYARARELDNEYHEKQSAEYSQENT